MPIYVYKIEAGGTVEVFQRAGDPPFLTIGGIPEDQILSKDYDEKVVGVNETVERIPSAPGGFQGLPTPKFHRRS